MARIDFASRVATYDDYDGLREQLSDDDYAALLSAVERCKRPLSSRMEQWKDSIQFVQDKMSAIMERQRARAAAIVSLDDL